MIMLFDPDLRMSIGQAVARTIEAIGRLCDAFVANLMRRHVRKVLQVRGKRGLGESAARSMLSSLS